MFQKRIMIFSMVIFFAVLALNTSSAKAQEVQSESKPATEKTDELRDQEGRTPLMKAVERGDAAEVFALLNSGADVEAKKTSGVTALMNAAGRGRRDIL